MTATQIALNGKAYHHVETGLTIVQARSLRNDFLRESFELMSSYRLLEVGVYEGVRFINDSKSTNVNSAWWALEETSPPIVWIAGGLEKGNDYSILMELVKEKVDTLIPLGEDNRFLRSAFEKVAKVSANCRSMKEAVICARQVAEKGSTVLLAPACASFDLFDNYEHRGAEFIDSVRKYA